MNWLAPFVSTHPVRRARAAFFVPSLIAYAALYALFALLSYWYRADENWAAIFGSALTGSCVAVTLVWLWSDGHEDDAMLRAMIIGGVLLDLVFHTLARWIRLQVLADALSGVANLGLLLAAIGVGIWVARGLQKPHYLVMAAIVAALTDIFSVYAGPTKHLVMTGAFRYLSFAWGILGSGGVQGIIGSGDFIFLALFFNGVRRFDLDDRKTLHAMNAALATGFLSTLISPQGIPALPFMAVALLLVHWRELKTVA